MESGLRIRYDPTQRSIVEAVCEGFEQYCRIYRKFPKTVYIPRAEAGYTTPLMEVYLRPDLQKGEIWLGGGKV